MNNHIMIVDDDRDIREGLEEVLTFEGFYVYSATNGKDALDQLDHLSEEDLPGCIFLDLNMPVMNGETFLKEIERKCDKLADIPICVASANKDIKINRLSHATVILKKPIELDQLYSVAHRFCD